MFEVGLIYFGQAHFEPDQKIINAYTSLSGSTDRIES